MAAKLCALPASVGAASVPDVADEVGAGGTHQQQSLMSVGLRAGLVDTKFLCRPLTSEGIEGKCQDWAFIVRSYPGCAHDVCTEAIRTIDAMREERMVDVATIM